MQAQYWGLFNMDMQSQNGFSPYFLGDKGCPLLPWIMTSHKQGHQHFVLKVLYNKKHKCEHVVVENACGILKKTFREIMGKKKMDIALVPNIFTFCILHNLINLGKKELDIQKLLQALKLETTQNIQKNVSTFDAQVHVGLER